MNEKIKALTELQAELLRAAPEGKSIVFGEGDPDARLAIVGEAPGREEERLGRPFVGRAGRFLDRLLAQAGLERNKIWVTNAVKWRPTSISAGKVRTRTPRIQEMDQQGKWLERELNVIAPRLVLCLGTVAARVMITKHFQMSMEHGRWRKAINGSAAIATFHPAYALRRGGASSTVGRSMLLDLRLVKEAYGRAAASQPSKM